MSNNDFQAMMEDFLKSAQKMQSALKQAHPGAAVDHEQTVEGKAGVGELSVIVTVNLKMQVQSVKIAPALLGEHQAMLEELLVAAVNDANKRAQQMLQEQMMKLGREIGIAKE